MTGIDGKIVDGLALVLVIFIALLLVIGIGSLVAWEGSIPEGAVIWSILVFGSLLGVTTLFCCCLRAWVKEQ